MIVTYNMLKFLLGISYAISDNITILHVNRTLELARVLRMMFDKLYVHRKWIATLALS